MGRLVYALAFVAVAVSAAVIVATSADLPPMVAMLLSSRLKNELSSIGTKLLR